MSSLWQKVNGQWVEGTTTPFALERDVEDIVFEAPSMLPLSGRPDITPLRRQFPLAQGRIDILAVEDTGRPVILEVKLATNFESRRGILAQVISYAAYLERMPFSEFVSRVAETDSTAPSLESRVRTPSPDTILEAIEQHLQTGTFRLVLILDIIPDELLRAASYLNFATTSKVQIDLIELRAYRVGEELVIVPRSVDLLESPGPAATRALPVTGGSPATVSSSSVIREAGSALMLRAAEELASGPQESIADLVSWATTLSGAGLARLSTARGTQNTVLTLRLLNSDAGMAAIWIEAGVPRLVVELAVVARRAPATFERMRDVVPPQEKEKARWRVSDDSQWPTLTDWIRQAYEEAADSLPRIESPST